MLTRKLQHSSEACSGCWLCRFAVCVRSPLVFLLLITLPEIAVSQSTTVNGEPEIFTDAATYPNPQGFKRGAICLVGAARDFELTGPSIKEHLLGAYPNADVFINMVLDHKTHTVSFLHDVPNLVRVIVSGQWPMRETGAAFHVLSGDTTISPLGRQGLMQYFKIVEGCLNIIDDFMKEHSVEYDWILRTRMDTFWTGPPPTLSVKKNIYVVPEGSRFYGSNDRFGFGGFNESRVALSRLSLLGKLDEKRYKSLNSEMAFARQLRLYGIQAVQMDFNFCVLTRRVHIVKLATYGVPIVALSSKGPMNGAKCAPCTPAFSISQNQEILNAYEKMCGWPGRNPHLKLCSLNKTWEMGWRSLYDELVGPQYAAVRKSITDQSYDSCVKEYTVLEALPGVYTGPPATVVCQIRSWKKYALLGKLKLPVYLNALNTGSVAYSVNFGAGFFMEAELQARGKCTVVVFQIKPWNNNVNDDLSSILGGIVNQNWTLSSGNDHIKQLLSPSPSLVSSLQNGDKILKIGFNAVDSGPYKSLGKMGQVDLLTLVVNNNTLVTIIEVLSPSMDTVSICQLILRLRPIFTEKRILSILDKTRRAFQLLGFTLTKCTGKYGREKCVFLPRSVC